MVSRRLCLGSTYYNSMFLFPLWQSLLIQNLLPFSEFGHLIGLGHSNVEDADYQDKTCYMASGGGGYDHPQQSFNAAKNWKLNFYSTRHFMIDPTTMGPCLIQLAAFVDFDKTRDDQPVIVNIADRFFMQYNRAKSFNAETRNLRDHVIVVESNDSGSSKRRAGLNVVTPMYNLTNYADSGSDLLVVVCSDIRGDEETPDVMESRS